MTGSLREIRPGVWKVEMHAGTDSLGRQQKVTRTFHADGPRAAKKQADAVRGELRARVEASAAEVGTVAELAREWLALKERRCSPTTMGPYRQIAAAIVSRFGRVRVDKLTGRMIDQWYAELEGRGMTPATIGHWHSVLRAMLRQAERWEMVDKVATRQASPPKVTARKVTPPTAAAVQVLLDRAHDDLRPILILLAGTGMRRGEVLGLRWSDLGGEPMAAHVTRTVIEARGGVQVKPSTKSGHDRTVQLPAAAVVALVGHLERLRSQADQLGAELDDAAFVFPDLAADPRGLTPRPPTWLSKQWSQVRGEAKVRLHDLRHWHASQLLSAGRPVQAVSSRLGHLQVKTTLDVYAHLIEGDDQASADAIDAVLALPAGGA